MQKHVLAGMTINERLYALGLIPEFDEAIKTRNSKQAIALLQQAELSESQASETVATILAQPAKYGYSGRGN